MAKRIQISPDSTNWYTFPGNKGDMNHTAGDIKDTVFGQDYESGQSGMISWNVSCNGLFKGFAGYVTKIKKSGTPTVFTGEATTLVSGKTYKIAAATKNVWDRSTPIVVKDGATDITATQVQSIDYLFGRVTLKNTYTPSGAITFGGKYLPMTQVGGANGFTLTQNAVAIDETDYEDAQGNSGHRVYSLGLKTVKLALKGIYSSSNAFEALLASRSELVVEIDVDGSGLNVARGWFKTAATGQSGNVGELEDSNLDFILAVPDQADISLPFAWVIDTTSTLSRALKEALIHYQTGSDIEINYLADGTSGFKGDAIITDLSLSGGLDVMNEFSIKFQGSGVPVAYP